MTSKILRVIIRILIREYIAWRGYTAEDIKGWIVKKLDWFDIASEVHKRNIERNRKKLDRLMSKVNEVHTAVDIESFLSDQAKELKSKISETL